jgi:hypothetical protein
MAIEKKTFYSVTDSRSKSVRFYSSMEVAEAKLKAANNRTSENQFSIKTVPAFCEITKFPNPILYGIFDQNNESYLEYYLDDTIAKAYMKTIQELGVDKKNKRYKILEISPTSKPYLPGK